MPSAYYLFMYDGVCVLQGGGDETGIKGQKVDYTDSATNGRFYCRWFIARKSICCVNNSDSTGQT